MSDRSHLFILNGPRWTLPITVVWHNNMALVRPGSAKLTRLMVSALLDRFKELGNWNGQDWFLTRETLLANGRAIDCNTHGRLESPPESQFPEDWISWTMPDPAPIRLHQPPGSEGLFEALSGSGFAPTPAKAQTLHGIWCDTIFKRLLKEKKPVDLGFAILEAFPVRADWRQMVIGRYLKMRKNQKERWSGRQLERAKKLLVNGRLMMAHLTERRLYWTVTLRHTKQWWSGVKVTEEHRLKTRRKLYFMDALRFLRERKDTLYALLLEYVAQARRPYVWFPTRAYSGSMAKQFGKPNLAEVKRFLRRRGKRGPLHPFVGSNIAPLAVGRKVRSVSRVPRVRPETKDVRDAGAQVVQPGDGTGGTGGLPVLDPGQDPPAP